MNFNKFFNGEDGEDVFELAGLRILKPINYTEARMEILNEIKQGKIVIFNLERLSKEDILRTLDYVLGATELLGGKIEIITENVYVSVPKNIKIENKDN